MDNESQSILARRTMPMRSTYSVAPVSLSHYWPPMHTRRPLLGRHRLRSLLLSFAMLLATGFSAQLWARNVDDTADQTAADQTAMAIPRVGMPGARSVALPQPLSPGDVATIRQIFALQRAGAIGEATREMDNLESDILRGAILADRYLDAGYTAEVPELSAWLERFGEQPDAPAIRALLETLTQRAPDAAGSARAKARPGQVTPNAIAVRTLLVQNDDQAAVDAALSLLASAPVERRMAEPLFAGGVAAWRLNDLLTAKPLFEAAWRWADTPALRAAAAFWIARVAENQHDRGTRVFWLRRAAREADTFYGPVARRALDPIGPCLPSPS